MSNRLKLKVLPLLIAIIMLFAGCSKAGNTSGTDGKNTPTPAAAGQTQQPTQAANRHAEIFDPSKDAGKLVVRFLYTSTGTDTKSGDSTIIKTPDGKVMLIDGSAPETANTIKQALDALGIKKIDALVASHPHIDHVGGLTQIVYQYDIDKVYRSKVEYPTKTNDNFLKAIEDRGIETVILKDGMSFDFGDTKVDVYSPTDDITYPKGFPDNSTAFLNDNSVVLKMTYKDSKILLPGDLYIGGEKSLLDRHEKDIQADILKMPHHGSDTSSSSTFIDAVQPKVAVAMYDQLASLSVYNSYRKRNVQAYITAVDGSVMVVADGTREYKVVTEKDRTSDFLK
jgi:competence protein ComEC